MYEGRPKRRLIKSNVRLITGRPSYMIKSNKYSKYGSGKNPIENNNFAIIIVK